MLWKLTGALGAVAVAAGVGLFSLAAGVTVGGLELVVLSVLFGDWIGD